MLPLWYSLKEVIKVPELADGATSQGMLKAGEFLPLFTIDLLKTDRQRKGQSMGNTFRSPIISPEDVETFHTPEPQLCMYMEELSVKSSYGLLPVFQVIQQESRKTRTCHC